VIHSNAPMKECATEYQQCVHPNIVGGCS